MNIRFVRTIALFSGIYIFCACSNDKLPEPIEIIWESGNIGTNRRLSGKVYFKGIVKVTKNSILTIQPGTELIFNSAIPSALIIDQGSQINAVGTPSEPITFTSDKAVPGAWGGIIITGRAPVLTDQISIPTNTTDISSVFSYGGNDETDNSGQLKYVRILYAGGITNENLESPSVFNGLTLCGVGSNTNIEYVQIHKSARDGFALFGGTVKLRHIIATSLKDDGLYVNEGWLGVVQFFVVQMTNRTIGNGIELENQRNSIFNNKLESSGPPCSFFRAPKFINVTIIGKNEDIGFSSHAVYYKQGSHGFFQNLITVGFEKNKPFKIETSGYTTYLHVGFSTFQLKGRTNPDDVEEPNTQESEKELLMTKFNYFNELNGSYTFTDEVFSPTSPDFSNRENLIGLQINKDSQCDPDEFLTREIDSYNFRGAVGNGASNTASKDWTKRWTAYPE